MNDFSLAVNYMAGAIDLTIKNLKSNNRHLSDLNSRGGPRGRGPGHGGRNGNGYGRGGRSRNSNNRGRGRRGRGNSGRLISLRGNGNNKNEEQSLISGYSREEWQNLSQADRNRVICARERLETARTVATLLKDHSDQQDNDVSACEYTYILGALAKTH
jgi:hypothetical protein